MTNVCVRNYPITNRQERRFGPRSEGEAPRDRDIPSQLGLTIVVGSINDDSGTGNDDNSWSINDDRYSGSFV